MPYSKFATHCPHCNEITEPVHEARQRSGIVKATYRCEKSHSWQQDFNISFDAPTIEPPEETEEVQKPPVPKEEVMEWDEDTRDQYIKHYGRDAYKNLMANHFREGEAFAEAPEEEPKMPQVDDPRQWTDNQRENFIEQYGRDKYGERLQYAYAKDNGFED